jgi:hypothetical protein
MPSSVELLKNPRVLWPSAIKGARMKQSLKKNEDGKLGYILAWVLGVPIPILLIIFLLRGCN